MLEAISDTGPFLHLHEVKRLPLLGIFHRLLVPGGVVTELQAYHLTVKDLSSAGLQVSVAVVDTSERDALMAEAGPPIQPVDAEVMAVACQEAFRLPVLTDDLALRRRLEAHKNLVIGSIGILVRAYNAKRIGRSALEEAVDKLFTASTLRLSGAFRAYVMQLLSGLP